MTLDDFDKLLIDYAAGHLHAAHSFLVATHLALNTEARARVAAMEHLQADMLEKTEPAEVSSTCLEKVLERIGLCQETPCAEKTAIANELGLPAHLLKQLCAPCGTPAYHWRPVGEGVERIELRICRRQPRRVKLRLWRLAGGERVVPVPTLTVVLQGSATDGTRQYRRGDMGLLTGRYLFENGSIFLVLTEEKSLIDRFFDLWA